MSDLKPVIFRITLDTADAQKQLDALSKGGGKGSPDGKGVPQAPKPPPNSAGRSAPVAPGRSGFQAGLMMSATSGVGQVAAGGVMGGSPFAALAAINNAVLQPDNLLASAVDMAANNPLRQLAEIPAQFLERVVPVLLDNLASKFPDMPFFKEYARQFDEVSDKITEMRAIIDTVAPTIRETGGIDRAILAAGGSLDPGGANTVGLFRTLYNVNVKRAILDADIEKEMEKKNNLLVGVADAAATALIEGMR